MPSEGATRARARRAPVTTPTTGRRSTVPSWTDRRCFPQLLLWDRDGRASLGGGLLGAEPGQRHHERVVNVDRRRRAGQSAKVVTAMNVIVICLDTLRADVIHHLGAAHLRTPTLDAMARDGVWFDHGYAESLPAIPARRSLTKDTTVKSTTR